MAAPWVTGGAAVCAWVAELAITIAMIAELKSKLLDFIKFDLDKS
jgi:hypothetical protein